MFSECFQVLRWIDTESSKLVHNGKARSRNELIVTALSHELAAREREVIDAAFAKIASDPDCQADAHAIAEEFVTADREALPRAETDA